MDGLLAVFRLESLLLLRFGMLILFVQFVI